ncbi:spermatogenesis-associated protein 6-like isoform X2 [Pomacea canaliculata]|uniref:spermatogenesis-associated protein 6-like isoform X2 n=1 Tax=Pomacea canaliculata TaxID=400727 RepID=UPI000D73E1AD|nr:spermatogenesis-associated protein 6-like isoform X2 [Pomacea canaliculata]
MSRRALRCVADVTIHAVSAPGVWLPSKEDVYLSISMFGQYRNTRCLTSVFPLIIHEKFRFEKTYYTALDPAEVADYLEDELVIFELLQLSEYTDGAVRLASFSTSAREFLYPYPSLAPVYSSTDREILFSRTVAFPGISPKLEFATKTVIKESISPEDDALEDAFEQEKERRTCRKTRRSPTRRLRRSGSLSRDLGDIDLDSTIDTRPPFVVRKLDKSLIGRVPGSGHDTHAKSKPKKPKRSVSYSIHYPPDTYCTCPPSSLRWSPYHLYHCVVCKVYERLFGRPYWGHATCYCPSKISPWCCRDEVIREPLRDPLPVYKSKFVSSVNGDEDAEVAELTSRTRSYYHPRPRSASPILYRSSFEDRYGSRPYSPNLYSHLTDRSLGRYTPRYSPVDRDLLDLEIATSLAKSRSPASLVHLDKGQYWTQNAAAVSGLSHQEVFKNNLKKIYNRLYRTACQQDPRMRT